MRTLRQIQGKIQGRIQALPLGHVQSWGISVILGAYLSLQLVGAGPVAG